MFKFTKMNGDKISISLSETNARQRTLVEEDIDPSLKDNKLELLNQPHDEVLLT